jgi:hypothetical protein
MYDHEVLLLLVRLVNQHSVGKADPSHVPNALIISFPFLFFLVDFLKALTSHAISSAGVII